MLAAGCATIVAVLISWALGRSLDATCDASVRCLDEAMVPLNERMQQMSVILNQISEQQLLSDRAKAVAYRDKDREALRRAIQEDLAKRDWEAALALANDIERQFGYKQEADRFRAEITARWQEAQRREISEAVAGIDRMTRAEQWPQALAEAERLGKIYPNDQQVKNLPTEIEGRRAAFKRQLLSNWNESLVRKDIDGSIEILKQLDPYLTPQEAEQMQEPVRNVFKEKLNNLRTQFSLAVQDHKWAEAIRIGDIIARDFPNTKIAQEVREKMDALRQRAERQEEAVNA
jgi:outer membrane protein assembly factor BamD (BamD/ComL family)